MARHRIRVDARACSVGELTSRFERAIVSPSYRPPPLPMSGLRLIELSQRSDVTFDDIMPMLRHDEDISKRVLVVAQSARYATRGTIASLGQALVRLGIDAVTRIFLEVSMQLRVYNVAGFPLQSAQLHRHVVATAEVASELALRANVNPAYAFLAGLLHDAGIAACLSLVVPRCPTEAAPEMQKVWAAAVRAHEKVGERLAELWRLPDDVAGAIAFHHGVDDLGTISPISAVIALAEALVTDAGVPAPEPRAGSMARKAAATLRLTTDDVDRYRDLARRACEPFRAASAAAVA